MPDAMMPMYKCHKKVWALKIIGIQYIEGGSAEILPEKPFAAFVVDREFLDKHQPEVGGYYVVYADGYKSYSPAKAFEEGYTLV